MKLAQPHIAEGRAVVIASLVAILGDYGIPENKATILAVRVWMEVQNQPPALDKVRAASLAALTGENSDFFSAQEIALGERCWNYIQAHSDSRTSLSQIGRLWEQAYYFYVQGPQIHGFCKLQWT